MVYINIKDEKCGNHEDETVHENSSCCLNYIMTVSAHSL